MRRSPWISQVGLKAITNVLMREAQGDHTHGGETTWRQSRDQTDMATSQQMLQPQKPEETRKYSLLEHLDGRNPPDSLISDFQTPNVREHISVVLHHPIHGTLVQQS